MKKYLVALCLCTAFLLLAACGETSAPTPSVEPESSIEPEASVQPEPSVEPESQEPEESETYSKDFESGVQNVTVQDLTYSVPTAWEAEDGNNGFTYYYTASGDSFLAASFKELNTEGFRVTEWEFFNAYISGMEGEGYKNTSKEIRQNKNGITYAHHTGEIDTASDVYELNEALFDCNGGCVQIGFMSKKDSDINYTQDINCIFDSVETPEMPSSPPDAENSPEPASNAQEEPSTETTTVGQRNALSKAKQYLSIMAFSHSGLISQLEFEGYTKEEATYGADNCGADWNEQAAKKAQQYIDLMSFSRQRLIDQLKFDGFTQSQAEYGVSQVGY